MGEREGGSVGYTLYMEEFFGMVSLSYMKNSPLIFNDRSFIYRYGNKSLQVLLPNKNVSAYSWHDSDLWYVFSDEIICASIGGRSGSSAMAECIYSDDNILVGIERPSIFDTFLSVIDRNTGDIIKKEGDYFKAGSDGINIVVQGMGEYLCFDVGLGLKWVIDSSEFKPLDKYCNRFHKPYLFRNLCIISLGYRNTDEGEIVGLCIKTGNKLWSYQYRGCWSTYSIAGDDLFLFYSGRLDVLCPIEGIVKRSMLMEYNEPTLFHSFNNELFAIADNAELLDVYDNNTLLKTNSIPYPELYKPTPSRHPIELNDVLYVEMTRRDRMMSPAGEGLLQVTRSSENRVEVETRPAMLISEVKATKNEIIYVITISEPDISRLMRFVAIRLFELGCGTGTHDFGPNNPPDKNHKGKFKLVVDPTGLPDNAEVQLTEWASDLEQNFKELAIRPGAGEKYRFTVDVEFTP